jgi:hypothetical protein
VVNPPGDERFDPLDFVRANCGQLGELDNPDATQVLAAVLGSKVGDLIGEPFITDEGTQRL